MDNTLTEPLLFDYTRDTGSRVKTKVTCTCRLGEKPVFRDTVDVNKHKSRLSFIQNFLEHCPGLDKDTVTPTLTEYMLEVADTLQKENDEPDDNKQMDNQPLQLCKQQLEETDPKVVSNAEKFLQSPDLIERIISHMQGIGIAQERELSLMVYLIGTSRLLDKPLTKQNREQSIALPVTETRR